MQVAGKRFPMLSFAWVVHSGGGKRERPRDSDGDGGKMTAMPTAMQHMHIGVGVCTDDANSECVYTIDSASHDGIVGCGSRCCVILYV